MAAHKRKAKKIEPVKVNIAGSTIISEELEPHDRALFIVEGTVSRAGVTVSATTGDQEFRTIKMESAIVAPEDVREQLAILVQKAKDDAAGVQAIEFPDPEAEPDGEAE